MIYYFSGANRAWHFNVLSDERASGMVNAVEAGQSGLLKQFALFDSLNVPLVLDSGAFQGNTNLEGYARLLEDIGPRFDWVTSLDVIGDQRQSDRNFSALVDRLDDRPELAGRVLWVYQGLDDPQQLEYLRCRIEADWNRFDLFWHKAFIGVGGLVPVLVNEGVARAVECVAKIGRVLEARNCEAHFFGVASPSLLMGFRDKEWFASADSSKWLNGARFGKLLLTSGAERTTRELGLSLTGEECCRQNVRAIHKWLTQPVVQSRLFEDNSEAEIDYEEWEEIA